MDGFRENGKSTHSNEGSLPLPPNSTLQVTLELVSWRTASEVTVDKKVVKEGKGYEYSNEGAVVKCKSSLIIN
jgi:FK506-binding protein 4/5